MRPSRWCSCPRRIANSCRDSRSSRVRYSTASPSFKHFSSAVFSCQYFSLAHPCPGGYAPPRGPADVCSILFLLCLGRLGLVGGEGRERLVQREPYPSLVYSVFCFFPDFFNHGIAQAVALGVYIFVNRGGVGRGARGAERSGGQVHAGRGPWPGSASDESRSSMNTRLLADGTPSRGSSQDTQQPHRRRWPDLLGTTASCRSWGLRGGRLTCHAGDVIAYPVFIMAAF